jgi:hypothetical protein
MRQILVSTDGDISALEVLRFAKQHERRAKVVAGRLWPHKPIEQAKRELLDALNRDNARKLCVEEVMAILRMAREAGYHGAKHWIDQDLGYQPTTPADPKIERDRLAEELSRAADNFKNLQRGKRARHTMPALVPRSAIASSSNGDRKKRARSRAMAAVALLSSAGVLVVPVEE